PKKKQLTTKQVKDVSLAMNEWDKTRQNDEINQYIKNRGWEMQMTGSGLRWMVLKKGAGDMAKSGNQVRVNYKITLMDGTVCYASEKDGPKVFLVNEDDVESGLHEAIQLMRKGDQMRFVLPSHLAHGLMGDEDKIPPRASVIYEIELLDIK
ncbi:MAG: FKBP-type peptidyl-prolyl cis-trans isomerase, partial [Bacteroidia bacterium]